VRLGREMPTHYFSCLSVTGFDKKRIGTHYVELVFLHLVGSAGHVVLSSLSRVGNIDVLFFVVGSSQCRFNKKRIGTRYA
jgi:hypothetical protein